MLSNVLSTTCPERQRIMIITADESLIDEIEKYHNVSFLEQTKLPAKSNSRKRSDKESKAQPSCKMKKSKEGSLVCVVCGAPATGYNFGAIACESCKAFFRRNARKEANFFQCTDKGDCEITSVTRRYCSACRLTKCFKKGMQSDRLSTDEEKAAKRRKLEENRNLALKSKSPTTEEELQLLPSTFSDDLLTSIDTNILFTNFISLLSPQPQQALLSSEDIERIETISNLYQNRIEFAAREGLPWDPSARSNTFLQVLNSQSVAVMRLLSFFKHIPEFNQLNVDDKVTLIKYNTDTILGINCVLSYNTQTHQIIESISDAPVNLQYYPILHGHKICLQAGKIFHSLLRIAKYDRKIIEFILIILIFTKGYSITDAHNDQILNDNMSVCGAQNYYVDLLWKYMELKHGYEVAVHLFSELMAHVVSWQTLHEEMRNNILRALSPGDIDELVPIMKSILRIS